MLDSLESAVSGGAARSPSDPPVRIPVEEVVAFMTSPNEAAVCGIGWHIHKHCTPHPGLCWLPQIQYGKPITKAGAAAAASASSRPEGK